MWDAERREAVLAFARYPERFAAGRQNAHPWHSAESGRCQASRRIDDMLAIVEQQQHSPVSEPGDQLGKRVVGVDFQAEDRRNRARHQARVG